MKEASVAAFFDAVAHGRQNTPEEWQEYLDAFHTALPHANELFTLLRRFDARTSYGVLANAVASVAGRNVLDLGCGDGNLIDELLRATPPSVRLVGVDRNPTEIAMTKDRYAGEVRVTLDVADARALPYEDGAFECVASHQVLNLFPRIDEVLGEVERVLKPDGNLTFVANRGWRNDRTANWMKLHDAAMAALLQAYPQFVWPVMGDMRVYREDGIAEIFEESGAWDMRSLAIETFNTRALMTPRQIAAIYNRLYVFATVPQKKPVLAAVERRARELSSDDLVEIDLPFRLIKLRKKA
jgi:ubiquinone/menaquinone biosynthesis C-methylase UbiE